MANIGHMNFFKVNECGLYKPRNKKSYGLDIAETFDLILNWAKDRSMSATIPASPQTSSKPKCYCREIYHDAPTGDYLIVLWKSDSDNKGSIWGVDENAANGTGAIVKLTNKHRNKKVIWGRPCYYWVIPSQNSVISIKFEHSLCDSQMFQEWVAACITNRVHHPSKVKHRTDGGYTRLSFSDGNDDYKYGYRFDMSLRSLDTSNVELERVAKTVTHIIKRETIQVKLIDQRDAWLKILNNIPFVSIKNQSPKRQVEIKIEAKPTPQEMKAIIEKFATEDRQSSGWDNVGFQTDAGVAWVDKYRLRNEITFSDTEGIFAAKELFDKIHSRRTEFIEPLLKAENNVTPITAVPERKTASGSR